MNSPGLSSSQASQSSQSSQLQQLSEANLSSLPLETICGILENLSSEELVRVLATSSWLREAVQRCTSTLNVGESAVPVPLLVSLPLVSRVNGFISIRNDEDLVYVSQRFSGHLSVIGGDSFRFVQSRDPGAFRQLLAMFNPQSIFLQALLVRASLYRTSMFRA